MSTEPAPPVPPLPHLLPRLGHGFVWSDLIAEMKDDHDQPGSVAALEPAPVVKSTPAGDHIEVQPAESSGVPWFLRWAC